MHTDIFKQIFYQSNIAQLIYSEDNKVLEGNEAFYDFIGFPKNECPMEIIEEFIKLMPENEAETKRKFYTNMGTEKVAKITKSVMQTAIESPLHHIQMIDITGSTKNERMYRLIAENSLDVINIHRLDGSYLYVSPSVMEATGFDPRDMLGKSPYEFIHEEDFSHCNEKHMELMEHKKPVLMTYRTKKKDGSYFWMETAVKPILDSETGEIQEIISISRNIETRITTNELMEKSEKLAVIGRMSAAVAHEIRNPLTPIKGFIQIFQATKEYNEKYGEVILLELERVENIISEFLTMAKPHHEKISKIDLLKTLENVIQLMETQALLENKSIRFDHDAKENYEVNGDVASLKQVFINVVQNALDAIEKHTGEVAISIEKVEPGQVCIKVKDNGPGIEKDRLAILGEPFYSTKEKGIGLGLMTSFKIIENHKGQIRFESELGEGTEVYICLSECGVLPAVCSPHLNI